MFAFLKQHKIFKMVVFSILILALLFTSIYIYDFYTLKSEEYGFVKEISKTADGDYQITFSPNDYEFYEITVNENTAIFEVGYEKSRKKTTIDTIDVGDIIDVKYRLFFDDAIRWIFIHQATVS